MVTDRDPRGLLGSNDTCSKTGRPVIKILWENRTDARIPAVDSFHEHPEAKDCFEMMPTFCYEDNVAKRMANLTGGAGPYRVERTMLCNWLLRHEI